MPNSKRLTQCAIMMLPDRKAALRILVAQEAARAKRRMTVTSYLNDLIEEAIGNRLNEIMEKSKSA